MNKKVSACFDCPVDIPEGLEIGEFVNAVRVLRDGSDALLDFMVYSPSERHARVITRLRVKPSFLLAVRERLDESVKDLDP